MFPVARAALNLTGKEGAFRIAAALGLSGSWGGPFPQGSLHGFLLSLWGGPSGLGPVPERLWTRLVPVRFMAAGEGRFLVVLPLLPLFFPSFIRADLGFPCSVLFLLDPKSHPDRVICVERWLGVVSAKCVNSRVKQSLWWQAQQDLTRSSHIWCWLTSSYSVLSSRCTHLNVLSCFSQHSGDCQYKRNVLLFTEHSMDVTAFGVSSGQRWQSCFDRVWTINVKLLFKKKKVMLCNGCMHWPLFHQLFCVQLLCSFCLLKLRVWFLSLSSSK